MEIFLIKEKEREKEREREREIINKDIYRERPPYISFVGALGLVTDGGFGIAFIAF